MKRTILCVLVLSLSACASPQRLSTKIYEHEELAKALDASGEHELAAAERTRAAQVRRRLGSSEFLVVSNKYF